MLATNIQPNWDRTAGKTKETTRKNVRSTTAAVKKTRGRRPGKEQLDQVRRYNLALPEELFAELERVAKKRHTTVVEILRRFVKLGLLAEHIEDTPGSALLIREGSTEKQIMLI